MFIISVTIIAILIGIVIGCKNAPKINKTHNKSSRLDDTDISCHEAFENLQPADIKDVEIAELCRKTGALIDMTKDEILIDKENGKISGIVYADGSLYEKGQFEMKKERQYRMVEVKIKVPMDFNVDMTDEEIDFYLNKCSWCSSNIIPYIEAADKEYGCLCLATEFKVLDKGDKGENYRLTSIKVPRQNGRGATAAITRMS